MASARNLTERVLSIRDDAFARLGDTDLADRIVSGRAPTYAITKVEDLPDGATLRRVEGTITVPNYLTPQVEVLPEPARDLREAIGDVVDAVPDEVMDALDPVTDAVPVDVIDVLTTGALSVPGSRFTYDPETGLPAVDPAQPTVDVPFQCEISRSSLQGPTNPMLYGHGLLGTRREVGGGSTARLRERGFSPCAVDWWGFSTADLPNVAVTLADVSNFASVIDRTQQGFLNFLYLGRALSHPQGLTAAPAFRDAGGRALVRSDGLTYDGNSQGGIMGGALTALAPDFERAVLGVPGMAYSTLLNRSVDWEGEYALVYQAAYPDTIDQQLGYALIQMLWDRGESSGYAQHMTDDPLPNTPSHEVFLQVAYADHQVANVAAEVDGPDGRHVAGHAVPRPRPALVGRPGLRLPHDLRLAPRRRLPPRLLVLGGHRAAGPTRRQPASDGGQGPARGAAVLRPGGRPGGRLAPRRTTRRRVPRRPLHGPPPP